MNPFEKKIVKKSVDFAKNRMRNFQPSHGWDHVERVIKLAEIISETEKKSDPFIVLTASILHDIAREDENGERGSICHAMLGSKIANDFLTEEGLDKQKADHISQCIKTHRFRDDTPPESIEAKILYDADKLDSIGAVGIGRAFLFSGEIGAKLHNNRIDITTTEAYSSEDSAYREYIFKLRFIKEKMFTQKGIAIAEGRHNFMEQFFKRLKNEIEDAI